MEWTPLEGVNAHYGDVVEIARGKGWIEYACWFEGNILADLCTPPQVAEKMVVVKTPYAMTASRFKLVDILEPPHDA